MEKNIILVDKPAGWTSFDVVAKLRGKIRADYLAKGIKPTKRQLKVGHAGTLDPFATGLLIILLGDECRRSGEFLKLDKTYEATIQLGAISTSGDPEGEIASVEVTDTPSRKDIDRAAQSFVGEITQVPPLHSAIKIDGVRAYKLARAGKEAEVPPRQVTIHSLEVLDYTYPELKIKTHVGSGTYIRTLAADIGAALGVGGYCTTLRRTQVGEYSIADAMTVEEYVSS